MSSFHPDLRHARWLPRGFGNRFGMWLERLAPKLRPRVPAGFSLTVRPASMHAPRVLIVSPPRTEAPRAAMLYMHGGGYVMGSPDRDLPFLVRFAKVLDMVVVAVDYRLAPEHPYPAPLDDCFAAFELLHREAAALGIDPKRVVIAGTSAGGGLAAGLTLRVHDAHLPPPLLQLLTYPMIDDRSTTAAHARDFHRLWDRDSNVYGWRAYLGREPGSAEVPAYAAPARREDLTGLPPTWIGVGTLDLFLDEDVRYAERLRAAGVPTTLEIIEGAYQGFDMLQARTNVSRRFAASQIAALRHALTGTT